jgi:hypothetical protein
MHQHPSSSSFPNSRRNIIIGSSNRYGRKQIIRRTCGFCLGIILFIYLIVWTFKHNTNTNNNNTQISSSFPIIQETNINIKSSSQIRTSNNRPNLNPHLTWRPVQSVRTTHQPKRGSTALFEQMAKPVLCPPINRVVDVLDNEFIPVQDRLNMYLKSPSLKSQLLQEAIQTCGGDVPMMALEEYSLLFGILRDTDAMLEWGSGKSSCIWSLTVGNLFSIEDSSTWVSALYDLGLRQNQMIAWVPSYDEAASPIRPPSSFQGYSDYIRYAHSIASTCLFNTRARFDVILVDGRARPQCAWLALSLLRKDGVLMIHDWEQPGRAHYRIVLRWFELLHVEKSLAIFKVKDGKTAREWYSNPDEQFPPWWYFDQDTKIWNTKLSDNSKGHIGVPFVEPFDEVDPNPSPEVMKPIIKSWTVI